MDEQFSELEKQLIEAFCNNEAMFEAVKKGLLAGLYSHGVTKAGVKHDPLQNAALRMAVIATENPIPDEMIGQHVRGIWAGINALENATKDLKNIKSTKKEPVETPYNEAV